jgi:hypothetical protein
MLDGIPVQLKHLVVNVDREHFEFNPTSCAAMKIEGTLDGSEGASAGVSSPFQVGGCASLPFAPTLTASTTGQASKADGTASGKPYPIEIVQHGSVNGTTTFTGWNDAVKLTPPANAGELSTREHKGHCVVSLPALCPDGESVSSKRGALAEAPRFDCPSPAGLPRALEYRGAEDTPIG